VKRKWMKFHQHETLNKKYKIMVGYVTVYLLYREKTHSDFGILVGLTWSNVPESYAGGSVATGRASQARQVRDDDPDKMSWYSSLGFGVELTTPPHNKYVLLRSF
jgi:hypothetical protein